MSIGRFVVERRESLGLRAVDLADLSGLHKSYLSDIEREKIALPNADIRRRLAKALGVSHLALLVAAGEITEQELGSVAGVVERDPDDVRAQFKAAVDQVRWTPERVAMMRSILTGMVEYDRKERGGS